jgi:hypothetical protein
VSKNQHGEVEILHEDNIIAVTVIGSFNEIGAMDYIKKVKEAVTNMAGKKYAILADCSSFEGGTPEVYEILEGYNQWLNTTNLVAKAIVIKVSITENLLRAWSPSFQLQTVKTFDEKALALSWLQTKLLT